MEGHFRFISILLALTLAPAAALAETGVPDTGDMGFDASDMGGDMGGDMAADMPSDMASDMTSDMASDMATDTGFDGGADDMGAASDQGFVDASTDTGMDMPSNLVRFSGEVRLCPDRVGAVTVLLIGEDDERYQQSAFSGESFLFEELPAGTYRALVSSPGFETVEDEELVLDSDTETDFQLSINSLVLVDISVDDEFPSDSDSTVTVSGSSECGEFVEEVTMVDRMGEFSRELAGATWELEFSADGFQSATQQLVVSSRDSNSLSVRLYRDRPAQVRVNESCSCNVAGASRTPALLAVFGMLFGVVLWRRRRAEDSA